MPPAPKESNCDPELEVPARSWKLSVFRQIIGKQQRLGREIVCPLQVSGLLRYLCLLHVLANLAATVLLAGVQLTARDLFQIRVGRGQQLTRALTLP